ncbi:hypothetical protein L1887_14592 [Cichorium endivia]|nr:hypothetical protein L1887_14592 [Cichorium endivia]
MPTQNANPRHPSFFDSLHSLRYLKMKSAACTTVFALAFLVMVFPGSKMATAATCSVTQLSPCLPAFTSSSPPSAQCCTKLKEQSPCLCGYIKNPSLKAYITSPNARKVASTCAVPIPKC